MQHELYPMLTDQTLADALIAAADVHWHAASRQPHGLTELGSCFVGDGDSYLYVRRHTVDEGPTWFRLEVYPGWGQPLYAVDAYSSGTIYVEDTDPGRATDALLLLRRSQVVPVPRRFYARQEDGRNVEVFWYRHNQHHASGDPSYLEVHRYVRSGYDGQPVLHYADGDFSSFAKRFWRGFEDGLIVAGAATAFRAGTMVRLHSWPDSPPYLVVDYSDNVGAVVTERYNYWHPADATPDGPAGEISLKLANLQGTYQIIGGWFSE